MTYRAKILVLFFLVPAFLTGCKIDRAESINKTNRDWEGFPLTDHPECKGRFKAWTGLPVLVFGEVTSEVEKAISLINSQTDIELLKIYQGAREPSVGIKMSYGTAYQPQNYKMNDFTPIKAVGTTSGEIGGWGYPTGYPLNRGCSISGKIVINLDGSKDLESKYGDRTKLVIAHEFLHALGIYGHVDKIFDNKGKVPVTDAAFDVLSALYRAANQQNKE